MSDVKPVRKLPEFYKRMGEFGRPIVAIDNSSLSRYNVNKESITRAIEQKDITSLREYSQYFFHSSGEYRRLVEYFGKLLTFDYVVVPTAANRSKKTAGANSKSEKALDLILDYTSKSYVKETAHKIALAVVKDGAFYGYERELDGVYVTQQLPTEFCRTRFMVDGVYSVEFNFDFFKQFRSDEEKKLAFESFPAEFAKLHKLYERDNKLYQWQMLDPVFARGHMLTDQVPFLTPVFIDLIELEDYKQLDKQRSVQQVEEVIIQKIPLDEDGEISMEMEEIETLHQNARATMGGSSRRVLTTPAEIKTLDFKNHVGAIQDDIEKATRMIYGSAGTPMVLFASGASGSSVGLERSGQTDEAIMYELLDQFERWYDNRFRALVSDKNVYYRMIFPHHSIFNIKEMQSQYQAAATYGLPTKLLWMASLGIEQAEMLSLLDYENETLKLPDLLIPVTSSHTQPGESAGKEGGRPESEEPLSEEGQKTRDQNKNDSRGGK